jgi:UbiD family decarboxylase
LRVAFHDLRAFLSHFESRRALRRVATPVDPELESTAFCLRTLRAGGSALLFERPRGSDHPLLGNLFGHRSRIEAALAARPHASLRELGGLLAFLKRRRDAHRSAGILAFGRLLPQRHRSMPKEDPVEADGRTPRPSASGRPRGWGDGRFSLLSARPQEGARAPA